MRRLARCRIGRVASCNVIGSDSICQLVVVSNNAMRGIPNFFFGCTFVVIAIRKNDDYERLFGLTDNKASL